MSHEDFGFKGDSLADEGVARGPAAVVYSCAILDFHEGADLFMLPIARASEQLTGADRPARSIRRPMEK
jgi:hypothetical protein